MLVMLVAFSDAHLLFLGFSCNGAAGSAGFCWLLLVMLVLLASAGDAGDAGFCWLLLVMLVMLIAFSDAHLLFLDAGFCW